MIARLYRYSLCLDDTCVLAMRTWFLVLNAPDVQVATDLTCFRGRRCPPISIQAYIERIAKYSKCSPVCFVMAWAYLKRISAKVRPQIKLGCPSAGQTEASNLVLTGPAHHSMCVWAWSACCA